MAFKLRSNNVSAISLHKEGTGSFKKNPFSNIKTPLTVIDPTKEKVKKEKEKSTASEYEEIGRKITTRKGEQDGVAGTFTDTNITERMDYDDFIPRATPGAQTTNVPEYLETLKRKYPGVPGNVLVEQGFIGPEFEDQFPLDYDQRERLESDFVADEEVRKQYEGIVSGFSTASDFGRKGYGQNYDFSDNNEKSRKIIRRMRANEESDFQPVEKIRGSFNQGGSAGLVDTDRRNRQAEQGQVFGIINKEDYDLGQDFGMGYINENYKQAINNARQSFQAHRNPERLKAEKEIALALANKQRYQAKSGTFATPEMEQKYNQSYDTLYSRMINDPKTGGGRSGRPVTSATTNVDTKYFN
tara:strand:+ start:133 stop:1203 length:1071 start_codon:yes stop_codon:yes gene_type:complete